MAQCDASTNRCSFCILAKLIVHLTHHAIRKKSLLWLFCCLFHILIRSFVLLSSSSIVLLLKALLVSSFEKETVWCFFTSCENVETLAVDLGLNQSKFGSKPFSILTIFPEVPEEHMRKLSCVGTNH